MNFRNYILLSCQKALLGAITSNVRLITIDFSEQFLHWRVYFDNEPTYDEKDTLSVACTEVLADLPPNIIDNPLFILNEEYITLPYPQKPEILREYVYLRYEDPIDNE